MAESNDTAERWLPIVGWEGIYEVSDLGRVKRVAPGKTTTPGRILRGTDGPNGYPIVRLRYRGRTQVWLVHRLVAFAFLGPPQIGQQVNHKDGVRTNPAVANLEWVTESENKFHSYRVLKRAVVAMKGERNPKAKLTDAQVREIRQRYAAGGVTMAALGSEFGVQKTMVSMIVRRDCWRHVV